LTNSSDFDGTIVLEDTGHVLFDRHGCGPVQRKKLDDAIHTGTLSFREASEKMWGSVNVPPTLALKGVKETVKMDPGFRNFYKYCLERNIPITVVSAGVTVVVRDVLGHFLSEEARHIAIVANDVEISADGREWKVHWMDDTDLGHDKRLSLQKARAEHKSADIIFIGDGVSDLPAASECDILFARRGLRLHNYCVQKGIPCITFDTFADIQAELSKMLPETLHRQIRH
jgi:2,3-diketo-5-methylthio-1-phosphopentane phosphatase